MRIRLLTYNCCALPLLTPHVRERLRHIAAEIRNLDPDIICLQEIGLESHARILRGELDAWPHHYWMRRKGGLISGGMVLFSKFSYARASFIPYSIQGPWLGLSSLARLSRKGIMRVDWDYPSLRLLHTHLLANYNATVKARTNYAALQEHQYGEFIQFARRTISEDSAARIPLVVAGDLNIPSETAAYRRMISELGLTDLMEGNAEPSMVREQLFGLSIKIPNRIARLDYIFVSRECGRIKPERARFALDRSFCFKDGTHRMLSDHLGVLGEFLLNAAS